MKRVALEEYGEVERQLSEGEAAALAQAAGSRLALLQAKRPGWHRIKASSFVGTIVAGDLEVRIRPKVPIANVLLLLDIAGLPAGWLTDDETGYASDRDALAAFAMLYGRTLNSTLIRGALRGYREHDEQLIALRGRIDLARQFRRPDQQSPVHCRYTDLTADIAANRYVKYATRLLLRTPDVPSSARRLCRHGLQQLDEVADRPPPIDLPERIVHTRLTRHYEPLLGLAGILRRSLTLTDRVGGLTASTFLLDMNALFERFLEGSLREALRGQLTVSRQETTHLDIEERVAMRPDLVLRDRNGRVVLVGDVKYKLIDDGVGRPADHYQLLAYATRYGIEDGVLLYATADGASPPRVVTVHGSSVRLHTLQVDLSGSPEQIRTSLAEVASNVRAIATGRRHATTH